MKQEIFAGVAEIAGVLALARPARPADPTGSPPRSERT